MKFLCKAIASFSWCTCCLHSDPLRRLLHEEDNKWKIYSRTTFCGICVPRNDAWGESAVHDRRSDWRVGGGFERRSGGGCERFREKQRNKRGASHDHGRDWLLSCNEIAAGLLHGFR